LIDALQRAESGLEESHMPAERILGGKHAVILGAGGAVGSAVAREFAAEGAEVYVSGRAPRGAEQTAGLVKSAGGIAHAAVVDALDEAAVDAYLDVVAERAGSIDILFNAMGPQAKDFGNGTPTVALSLAQFMLPLSTMVQSQFITARAAARHMVRQHAGVILMLTANPARGTPGAAAVGATFGAMEALLRCLAAELGPSGVRVTGIRSGGLAETRTIQQTLENIAQATGAPLAQVRANFEQRTPLKPAATVLDTARLAAFLASDAARPLAGAIVNASGGAVVD
jgi:NAD(P)-dependent dehydrogenase (short-subunit alcohol dehydrogenase family)